MDGRTDHGSSAKHGHYYTMSSIINSTPQDMSLAIISLVGFKRTVASLIMVLAAQMWMMVTAPEQENKTKQIKP